MVGSGLQETDKVVIFRKRITQKHSSLSNIYSAVHYDWNHALPAF